jgi:hypothetical protein
MGKPFVQVPWQAFELEPWHPLRGSKQEGGREVGTRQPSNL